MQCVRDASPEETGRAGVPEIDPAVASARDSIPPPGEHHAVRLGGGREAAVLAISV
jgi:hypothetical protein